MKSLVYLIIQKLFTKSITSFVLFYFFFKYFYISLKNNKIYVIDIDNTIADTWPSLKYKDKYNNEFERYSALRPFNQMKEFLFFEFNLRSEYKLFLSARNIFMYNITLKWLVKNDYYDKFATLILVPDANYKLHFLKILIFFKFEITYIDDLSYNHEKKQVLFYHRVIEYVKNSSSIKYIGYQQIIKHHAY